MRTLSVFEYGQVEPLTSAEKNLLDQLRGPCNERLFEVGWRETRATSFVGVVQLPQTTLQVLPKMYRHDDAKECEATANLLFLLNYTRKLDVTEPEIARLTEQRAPFSKIIFWVFAHRLWDAVHREVLRGHRQRLIGREKAQRSIKPERRAPSRPFPWWRRRLCLCCRGSGFQPRLGLTSQSRPSTLSP
jgi:hypothetical protein